MPTFKFTVDGKPVTVNADSNEELLWVLRDRLGIHSVRYGCGVGLDGVCTALVNGEAVRTCITPVSALATPGSNVTTVAGLSDGEHLHPVQQAWIDNDVAQCGYCQAGQIMSAVALLKKHPNPTDEQIDQGMAGNLCRCGTYFRIRSAIKDVAAGKYAPGGEAKPTATTVYYAK
jgi:isoquinoline 1-oxidoreductase alpha subunit